LTALVLTSVVYNPREQSVQQLFDSAGVVAALPDASRGLPSSSLREYQDADSGLA